MKINTIEKMAVNNFMRQWLIRRNMQKMKAWAPELRIHRALEIGCGYGAGIRAIDAVFSPGEIYAIDMDEKMVQTAQKRTGKIGSDLSICVAVGEALPFLSESFDAVFELTIFHHIPQWQKAVSEVVRVLKPGGIFFFEELAREYHFDVPVLSFIQQKFTVHPWETIPDTKTFYSEIESAGLEIIQAKDTIAKGWLLGAAKKPV